MKKLIALVLLSCLTALSSRADVVFQELFKYTNGPVIVTSTNDLAGVLVTNWIRFSGTASPSDLLVKNNRLEVDSSSTYLGVTATRTDDCGRLFATASGSSYTNAHQLIYVSYVVNFTNPPTTAGTYFGHFKYGAAGSTSYEGKIFALAGTLTNTYRLAISAAANTPSQTYAADLALNTDYQVVLEWDPVTLSALSMWINPISTSDTKVTSGDAFTPGTANIVNMYAFRQASGFGGFLTVSNLVVATTFDEALTNVLATNAVAPRIAVQPAAVTTNFQNATLSLTALASGQGQSSLIYQWQVSASAANTSPTDVSNPNGNSSILSVDTTTISTRYYTLIVTTPYGLSTTSSVAKVAIIAPVGPPLFITQPTSQTAYSGQTVTLTTSVLSPGNTTYTWYSNNVVVTDGQLDSGLSSSFVITAVTTNSSATYKVAVTNDTVATGIVSTNAVLTVLNPPTVSIAYLRTLVDPNNNYTATNSTQPYQVTGIVTTYTNLTQGNTSSYYLQDATAGINIFATFGSTFRPAQGDVVTFVGVVSSFSSGLELYADTTARPYTSYAIVSNNFPLPAPLSIPFTVTNNNYSNMNYTIAGKLVQLSGVYFGTNAGTSGTNGFMTVSNSVGQTFRLWFSPVDLDLAAQPLPEYASTVTGVMFGSMNAGTPTFAVAVTKFSDIVPGTPSVQPIPLALTYVGGNLTFNWTDPTFSLQVATNVAGPYTTIAGAATGFSTNATAATASPALFFRLFHE